jgi:hypothetical protein
MLVQDPQKPWLRVRYYGWRIKIFSLFPNAISLKIVDKDYTHIPIFNIVLVTLLIIAVFFIRLNLRRFMERLRQSEKFQSVSRSTKNLFRRGER